MMSALKKIWEIISRPRVRYDPLVKVFIDSDALRSNYKAFAGQFPGLAIAPVLKSNAYGHGLREVASVLDSVHAPFFAVDSFYEALVLRRAGVKTPILIIGYTREDLIRRKTLRNVAFTVADLHVLSELAVSLKRPQRIHLKVDTGMHRQGVMPHEVPIALDCFKKNPNLILEGVYSHLSDADNPDPTFTNKQITLEGRFPDPVFSPDGNQRIRIKLADKGKCRKDRHRPLRHRFHPELFPADPAGFVASLGSCIREAGPGRRKNRIQRDLRDAAGDAHRHGSFRLQ